MKWGFYLKRDLFAKILSILILLGEEKLLGAIFFALALKLKPPFHVLLAILGVSGKSILNVSVFILLCSLSSGLRSALCCPADLRDTIMVYREIVVDTVTTTSLKGVPKIVKAKEWPVKLLWSLGFVILLTACIYQTQYILVEYFKYPSVTSIQESVLKLYGNDSVRTPDIFICNLQPFSSNTSGNQDIPTPDEFLQRLDELETCTGCSDEQRNLTRELAFAVRNRRGYIQYIGYENAVRLAHDVQDMILDCNIELYTGTSTYVKPCGDEIEFVPMPHQDFVQCFEVKVPPHTESQIIIRVSIELYLDTFYNLFASPSWMNEESVQESYTGANIVLYHPDRYPFPCKRFYAPPGKLTRINYEIQSASRLSKPYGTCQELNEQSVLNALGRNFSYTWEACKRHCMGHTILNACGCIDIQSSWNMLFDLADTYPFCFSVAPSIEQINTYIPCAVEVRAQKDQPCQDVCQRPCEEDEYMAVTSTANWPAEAMYQNFYRSQIANKPYAPKFSILDKACSDDNCTTEEMLKMAYLVERNFAKIEVALANPNHKRYVSKPKLSIPALFSQLGGVLNLWSGITVIVLIEVLECILKVFMRSTKSKSKNKVHEVSEYSKSDQITNAGPNTLTVSVYHNEKLPL